MKLRFFVELLVLASACSPAPSPRTGPAQADAARAPTCAAACTNLRALGCTLGSPTPKGASCETVCDNVRVQNAGAGFPTSCLAGATSCTAADDCR